MATKILTGDRTGYILIHKYREYYRLTSTIHGAIILIDFDSGIDEFLSLSCSNADLGAAVRRCLDASKRVDFKDINYQHDESLYCKKMKLWDDAASKIMGADNNAASLQGGSCARCVRDNSKVVFFNFNESSPGDFTAIPDTWPEYREFLVIEPASNDDLGVSTRLCLDAIARGANAPDRLL